MFSFDAWIILFVLLFGDAIAVLIIAGLTGAFSVPVEPMDDSHVPSAKQPTSLLAGKYLDVH
jgi:hypothetical protein